MSITYTTNEMSSSMKLYYCFNDGVLYSAPDFDGYAERICDILDKSKKEDNMERTNYISSVFSNVTITDYKVINNTVVIVTFADGTTEKAVCNKNDTYDFERAIEICICKKKFGGTKEYNTAIKNALRQVKAVDDKKKKEAEETELAKRREAKIAKRKAKRKEQRRQQRIDDMSEAFLKAMLDYDDKIFEMDDINKDQTSNDVNIPENVSD